MLKHRLLTALFGVPLLLGILLWLDKVFVAAFFLACAALSVWEASALLYPKLYSLLVGRQQNRPINWRIFITLAAAALFPSLILFDLGIAVFILCAVILLAVFSAEGVSESITGMVAAITCLCYACLPWLTVWNLYLLDGQARYLLLILAMVMLGDSGAYFAGRALGKHLLAPNLSPNKTWEGLFGGLLAGTLGAWVMNWVFAFSMGPLWLIILLGIFGGSAGVLGDLVESALKRFAGVKDSGKVFPGHGGILDRCDALLFAAPVAWVILHIYRS